jgi:hypothetical protein
MLENPWSPICFLQFKYLTVQDKEEVAQHLEGVLIEAVKAVPAAEAAELWITGFRCFNSLGLPIQSLVGHLMQTLSTLSKGPLQV